MSAPRPARAARVALLPRLPGLIHNPLKAFEQMSAKGGDGPVRLTLGRFRPLLAARPEHVEEVLNTRSDVFSRDGMLWDPVRRLVGNGLASEGATWKVHRRMVQPMFSGKQFRPQIDKLAQTIEERVAALDGAAASGRPIDVGREMTRIVHRGLVSVLFGDKISTRDGDLLTASIEKAFRSLGPRLLMPFVPETLPVPGDGAFRRAARRLNRVMVPLVRHARQDAQAPGSDIVTHIAHWHDTDGASLTDHAVRDDVILMFVGGSETTAAALTWVWTALARHPHVLRRLCEEVDRVVGDGPVMPAHVPELKYTKMVIQETLRLYPVGWIIPRTATADTTVAGVPVRKGTTVILSPYLTHRLPDQWANPTQFDPSRFTPENSAGRHHYAYFPFGAGPHHCIGNHFFTVEAQLTVAAMLSRFRPDFSLTGPVTPQPRATLRPRQRVRIGLRRRGPARVVTASGVG